MDELCPYCQLRTIAMTLMDRSGSYHLCHVCAIQFGISVQASTINRQSADEISLLERWAAVPWPNNR